MNPSRVTDDSSLITNYPRVSTIILNWNGLEDTIECLESLRKITYPNYQVIVVDNGSKGNDVEVLEQGFAGFAHIIANDRNYGFPEGCNIGMRYALTNRADYILLLNNDTQVDPNFLSEMDKGQYDHIAEADWVTGCCFLVRRSVLEDIGLLDESYFSYWEETDYCTRAKKAGSRIVYAPKTKVWHKLEQSVKKVTGFARYYMTRNRFRFMKKHATKWQYRCFLIYFFGFYFWLATGYYLIYLHSLSSLITFYRGVKEG